MTQLGFGVATGSIFQYAYVVDDIHQAMGSYVERLGIGPWSLRDRFSPPSARLWMTGSACACLAQGTRSRR